jgi:hypothetical protein
LCGIASAIFIARGSAKTKRTKEVEERLRAALAMEYPAFEKDEQVHIPAPTNVQIVESPVSDQGGHQKLLVVPAPNGLDQGHSKLSPHPEEPPIAEAEDEDEKEKPHHDENESFIDEHMTVPAITIDSTNASSKEQ